MKPLLSCLLASTLTTGTLLAGLDTEPLTYNKNIWSLSPKDIAQRFPVYDWQKSDEGSYTSKASGLSFMGMSIQDVSLKKADNGTQSIELLIYSPGSNNTVSQSKFASATQVWKQLMDRNTGKVGRRMPTQSSEGTTTRLTSWEFDNSVAILSAKSASTPQNLTLTLYSKSAGLAYLNTDTDKDKKIAGDSAVLKQLKGKTSLLNGRRYKKQDIEGDPEYFLLYYSASW